MALLNTSLPNLIGGVSQQPDSIRFEGQCEEQTNAISSVVDGLSKRPNTNHIAKILGSIGDDSFVHFINRSASERYVVISYKEYDSSNVHTGCKLRAFNLSDGTEATITVGNTTHTSGVSLTSSQFYYLHASSPRNELKALSVGDTTFLLNSSIGVSLKKSGNAISKTPSLSKKALIFLKQGDYEKDYNVKITGNRSSGIGATATVSLSMYAYSSQGWSTTYRYRITGITITNGGSGYSGNLTLIASSSSEIYAQPSATFTTDSNGTITGATITNGGDFQYNTVTVAIVDNTVEDAALADTASITSGASTAGTNADTDTIMTALKTEVDTHFGNDFHIKRDTDTNLIEIEDQGGDDFSISASDGLSDTGLGVVYKEVNTMTDLPLVAPDGYVVKVVGDAELSQDDFYCKFETTNGHTSTQDGITSKVGKGVWVETVAPAIDLGVDANTLPHSLVNNGLNTFTLSVTNYADRLSGDDKTNPLPSFQGQTISNIFFFKNRLGFLSNDNVILSESGLGTFNESNDVVYNFGRTSVTTLLDSDPIDVAVSSSRVTNLKSAKGFQENLIIFAENGQFVLKGGDILTPRTVSITPVTNFDSDSAVDPITLGAYVYFPYSRSGFTGVREYTVNASTDVYDSTEITEHIPRYIPSDIIAFSGTSSEDALVLVSNNDKSTAYVYRYFFNGQKKLLSSWFKFTFDGDIRGLSFIKSELFIVLEKNSETHIVSMSFDAGIVDTGVNHNTYLDLRRQVSVAAGASTIDLSSFYTPADNTVKVFSTDGAVIKATNSGATVTLTNGALSSSDATNVFVGIPYTMIYTFSKQMFKQASGQSKSPSAGGIMKLKSCSIFYTNTAFFTVKVTPIFRDTYVNNFTTNIIGTTNLELNLDDGFFRVPVFSNAEDTKITIENDSALPSHFQSAEFEVNAHQRSRRF